jgi:hypothetical protein
MCELITDGDFDVQRGVCAPDAYRTVPFSLEREEMNVVTCECHVKQKSEGKEILQPRNVNSRNG